MWGIVQREDLSDLKVVMLRHSLPAFILPTVVSKLKCVVFTVLADYSSFLKRLSEHRDFLSTLPAFVWRLRLLNLKLWSRFYSL